MFFLSGKMTICFINTNFVALKIIKKKTQSRVETHDGKIKTI